MKMTVLEVVLCAIEMISAFVFFNSLMQKRFRSVLPLPVVALIATGAVYFCSALAVVVKSLGVFIILLLANTILYKDNILIKLAYSALFLYVLFIQDIISGTFLAMITDKEFLEVFYSEFEQRMIFCLTIKVLNIITLCLIYRKYSKITNSNIVKKYWGYFSAIIMVYLIITVVFMVVYPQTDQGFFSSMMYFVISLSFFIMSMIVIYFFAEICLRVHRDEKMYILESEFNALNEQMIIQNRNSENLKKVRHDIRKHLININALIETGDINAAVDLLHQVSEQTERIDIQNNISTGNSLVDAIISSKSALCDIFGVHFEFRFDSLLNTKIEAIDISSLLSNLLDNAIEAALKTENPYVFLKIYKYHAYYAFYIENSCKNVIYAGEKQLISTKNNDSLHGFGTQIIAEVVRKYDGEFDWQFDNGVFKSTVLLKI